MERLMLLPCLVLLLVGLVSPVRAEEGVPPDAPMDGIVEEEPPSDDPALPASSPTPGDLDADFDGAGLDGMSLPEETVDYTAVVESLTNIQETLSRLETLLAYIFVACLFFFIVSAGKLIYSFFNMFF